MGSVRHRELLDRIPDGSLPRWNALGYLQLQSSEERSLRGMLMAQWCSFGQRTKRRGRGHNSVGRRYGSLHGGLAIIESGACFMLIARCPDVRIPGGPRSRGRALADFIPKVISVFARSESAMQAAQPSAARAAACGGMARRYKFWLPPPFFALATRVAVVNLCE